MGYPLTPPPYLQSTFRFLRSGGHHQPPARYDF